MKLKETIDSLIGKPVTVTINNSKLFPFGTDSDQLMLTEHSNGYYCVMLKNTCIWMFSIIDVAKYEISIDDNEIFDIKWNGIRIVNLDNI